VVAVSCLSLPVWAESKAKYYTWVDAQGNIHNTLIKAEDESKDTEESKAVIINPDDYPSEEEYQEKLKERSVSEKPFYTWTDAEGVVRSEVRPEVMVEFSATELVYDAVFAPPFRLPDYVTQGDCCQSYQELFITNVDKKGSASYKIDNSSIGFLTQSGAVPASYFTLEKLDAKEILTVKAYEIDKSDVFEVIALSESYQPLYLESSLAGRYAEQTWKDLAYKEVLLEVSDTEIKHLVIFVKSANEKAITDYLISVNREFHTSD
jgi:hypothetical protein